MTESVGAPLGRRDVLAGSGAAALGVTSLVLPAGAVASSVAVTNSLVAETGGIVYGWGTEWQDGVFGTQSGSQSAPVEVTGTSFTWPEIVQADASRYNSAYLTAGGHVYVSGSNQDGKLGTTAVQDGRDASNENLAYFSATPVQATISGVAQIAGGAHWMLALKTSGEIWAWGQSDAASGLGAYTRTPVDVTSNLWPTSAPTGVDRVVQIASNIRHSVALTATGRVFTWGSQLAGTGTLGQGSTDALTSSTAVELTGALAGTVGTDGRIIQVSCSPDHVLALGRDGRVYAWGDNNGGSGALGTGLTTDEGAPVEISANGDFAGTVGTSARIVQISAGYLFSLAVGLDGTVYSWGRPSSGRLGNDTTSGDVLVPRSISGVAGTGLPALGATSRRVVQVSARLENGYALGADGGVYGWGRGGRVGDGTFTQQALPVEITGSGAFANLSPNSGASLAPRRIVALGTGTHNDTPHALAIDDRG